MFPFPALSHPTRNDDRVVSYFDAVFHCRSNQSNQQKRSYSERTWIRRTWLSVSDRRLPAPVSPLDSILCRELQTIDPLLLLLLLLLYTRRFPSILFSFREKLENIKKKKKFNQKKSTATKRKKKQYRKEIYYRDGDNQHTLSALLWRCIMSKVNPHHWVWWSVVDLPVNLECLEFHFQDGGRAGVADSWWEMLVGTSLATCLPHNERIWVKIFLPNKICSWRRWFFFFDLLLIVIHFLLVVVSCCIFRLSDHLHLPVFFCLFLLHLIHG